MKKLILRKVLIVSSSVYFGCCPSIDEENIELAIERVHVENWSGFMNLRNNSINIDDFSLVIDVQAAGLENYSPPKRRSFFNSPDCDIPSPNLSLMSKVREIRIISLDDINPIIVLGSDVTHLFQSRVININPLLPQPEIQDLNLIDIELLNSLIVEQQGKKDLFNQEIFRFFGLSFNLNSRLNLDTANGFFAKFRIELTLEDNSVFHVVSPQIKIDIY